MVVSDNKVASEVGISILKKGGNAIDAAVATAFALEVTHPQAGNIGGGGFLVFMDAKNSTTTFDFREKAPLLATADMFLDSKGNLVKGSNHNGLKSVGVPGTVAGPTDSGRRQSFHGAPRWPARGRGALATTG